MIREFKILATNQIWNGYYLSDGGGDIQCLTNKGHEIFFEWEFELVTYELARKIQSNEIGVGID